MSNNYDMIATVDIDISSPIVDDTSFDKLIILGPAPKGTNKAPDVGVYYELEEVEKAGFVTTGDNADIVGVAARVAFSQKPRPAYVYIAVKKKVDEVEESVVDTAKRAINTADWYVVCPVGVSNEELVELAKYIETTEKICCYTETGFFGSKAPVVGDTYFRTQAVFGGETSEQSAENVALENQCLNVAWSAKWLSYESGSETAAFKELAVVKTSVLSTAEMHELDNENISCFVTVGNKNIILGGKTAAGEWSDVIRFRDWLKNDMQVRIVNLFVTTPKIPYTDSGIAMVQNQMLASLKTGQDRGGIAEDEFDANGTLIPGYTTSVPLAASIPSSEKASRKLFNCKFKARVAGAIHFAELTGSLTYEL